MYDTKGNLIKEIKDTYTYEYNENGYPTSFILNRVVQMRKPISLLNICAFKTFDQTLKARVFDKLSQNP